MDHLLQLPWAIADAHRPPKPRADIKILPIAKLRRQWSFQGSEPDVPHEQEKLKPQASERPPGNVELERTSHKEAAWDDLAQ